MPKYVNIPLCKSLEQKEEREQGEGEVGEKAATEHLPSFARPKMNEILDDKHDDNDKRPANATSISRTIQSRQQKPQSEAIFHLGAIVELENENAAALDASNLDKGQSEARDANLMNATPTNFSTLANETSIQNNSSGQQQQPQQPQFEAVFHQAAAMAELENENAAVLDALNLDKDHDDPKMNEILDDKQGDNDDDFDKRPANATSISAPIQNNSRGRHQQPQFEAVFHQAAMAELDNENAAVLDALNLDKDQFDDVYEVSRPVGAEGTGDTMAPPDFGRSANPISTMGAEYAHLVTTGPPGFSDLPMALVSAEDEPIVAAAEDKNPGEVANSLNEAVKFLKSPTTIEPGKVGYIA